MNEESRAVRSRLKRKLDYSDSDTAATHPVWDGLSIDLAALWR